MKIKIDVTDWEEKFDEWGKRIEDEEALIEICQDEDRPSPFLLAQLAIIDKEKHGGTAVAEHKYSLNLGAAVQVNRILARKKREENLKNGKKVTIRQYVCPVHTEADNDGNGDGTDNAVVDSMSSRGYDNAVKYLQTIVPGAIYGRLAIIAASPFNGNGEVRKYAEWLKNKIDDMVEMLEVKKEKV